MIMTVIIIFGIIYFRSLVLSFSLSIFPGRKAGTTLFSLRCKVFKPGGVTA